MRTENKPFIQQTKAKYIRLAMHYFKANPKLWARGTQTLYNGVTYDPATGKQCLMARVVGYTKERGTKLDDMIYWFGFTEREAEQLIRANDEAGKSFEKRFNKIVRIARQIENDI